MMTNEMKLIESLNAIAVDKRTLATNFTDVIPECCGGDLDIKTELMNRHPLYTWLIGTALSRDVRRRIQDDPVCNLTKGDGGYFIKVPGAFWSLDPKGSAEECCWAPFDFAKCAGEVPVRRLCLKDCDSVDDELMGRFLRVNSDFGGVARRGETFVETKKRIARLSMAFLTVYNIMYGRIGMTTDVLKEFHGLFDVMSNPAVVTIGGANVLSAFDSLACRITLIAGNLAGYTIGVNPITYQSLLGVVTADQYGKYPTGWTRNGDELRFHGIGFIQDRFVPVNLADGTGEAWLLDGESVGLWMATDLQPRDAFIKESGHQEQSLADGCGSSCTYYYNYGAAFNNNANKIARVVGIPLSATCMASTGDLGSLIMPTTLIPNI